MTATSRKALRMTWADRLLRALIYIGSFLLVLGLLVYDRSQNAWDLRVKEGDPSGRTVYAPFDFSYVNQKATEEARQKAADSVLPVYRIDASVEKEAVKKVQTFLEEFGDKRKSKKKDKSEPLPFYESLALSGEELKVLRQEKEIVNWQASFEGVLGEVFRGGITATDDAKQKIREKLSQITGKNRKLKDVFVKLLDAVVASNLMLDEKATAKRRGEVAKSTPEIRVDVKKGEMVILRGRRVSSENLNALGVIQKRTKSREIFQKVFSQALIVFLLYILLGCYFRFFEPSLGSSLKHLVLIHGLLVLNLMISKAILYFEWSPYLIPVSLVSLLLVPLVRPRIGFFIGFVMAALSSLLCGWSLEVFLFGLFGSLMGVFSAIGLRRRIQFVKVGMWVGAGQGLSIVAFQLAQGTPFLDAAQMGSLGLANGFLVTMPLFSLLLPVLEQGFNLTTDITLLELSDLNHPLLKRMVIEASGTYHHSLIVSHLSEEAAKVIGANALLARVGSYFHDIGKMVKSEYFVENQPDHEDSKHNQLTPHMSTMIILSHVKKGVELARQYKLKDVIVNFIPEHQGTGVVYYFYRKALEHKKEGEVVNPDDFRYPGPRPQSRETALVMLADSCEAASRSLAAYTPEAIRELVTRTIFDKLKDNQLDECDLMMKDIGEIRESFIRSLLAVYHTRIPYPKQDEENSKKAPNAHRDRDKLSEVQAR